MAGAFDVNGLNFNFGSYMGTPGAAPMGASNPAAAAMQMAPTGGMDASGLTTGWAPPGGGPGSGFGLNMPTANLALGGIQTIGNLWSAWEARKLAQDQFNFQKGITNTNLNNQIQSYNTTLEDRSRSRAFAEGQSPDQAQAYIDKNRLSR